MRITILEIVKDILSSMSSDDVSSIGDTVESVQVYTELKTAYTYLMSIREWPFLKKEIKLLDDAELTSVLFPANIVVKATYFGEHVLYLPWGTTSVPASGNGTGDGNVFNEINKVYWIEYNKKRVEYMPPTQFRHMLNNRVAGTYVTSDGIITNRDPLYWTTFDDRSIVFDSYNSAVDAGGLESSKSNAYVLGVSYFPQLTTGDGDPYADINNWYLDLPEKFYAALLSEAKAACFNNIKQQTNTREEYRAKDTRMRLRADKSVNVFADENSLDKGLNYGRK